MSYPARFTERQREVLRELARFIDERGFPPSLRELGELLGIRSTNGVSDALKQLIRAGYLHKEAGFARALRITDDGRRALR